MPSPVLEITTTANDLALRLKALRPTQSAPMQTALRRIGMRVQSRVVKNLSGPLLKKRTGSLARAVFYRVEQDPGEARVRIGVDKTKAPYARIQNDGGTIVPRQASRLAIPVGQALTGNGVARMSARDFMNNPQALGFDHAFVNKSRTAILGVRAGGKVAQIEAVFILKTSVRLTGVHYLERSLEQERSAIANELGVAVRDTFLQASAGPAIAGGPGGGGLL